KKVFILPISFSILKFSTNIISKNPVIKMLKNAFVYLSLNALLENSLLNKPRKKINKEKINMKYISIKSLKFVLNSETSNPETGDEKLLWNGRNIK